VDHGRDKQRRVGDPAGHDHVGPELQGLDDGAGAEVGHAEGDALADGGDAGAGVHVAEVRAAVAQLVDAGGDVVAGDRGHPQAVHAQVGGHPARGRRGGGAAASKEQSARETLIQRREESLDVLRSKCTLPSGSTRARCNMRASPIRHASGLDKSPSRLVRPTVFSKR